MRAVAVSVLILLGIGSSPAYAGKLEGWLAVRNGDHEAAFRELLPLAERGDPECQYEIGLMYRKGRGVTRDSAEAMTWYLRAAQQGHAGAANGLGAMFQSGAGVDQSYEHAREWYLRAAASGYNDAAVNLAMMYEEGVDGAPDPSMALHWYGVAAENQDPIAQWAIGNIYWVGGRGVPPDYAKARRWKQLAADQGYPTAQVDLSLMYVRGDGIPIDGKLACFWSSKAVPNLSKGSYLETAVQIQTKECASLSVDDRQTVDKMLTEWKADDAWGKLNAARFEEKIRKLREQRDAGIE